MNLIDTPITRLLERYLDMSAFRQGVIASNVANVDTPGYRTRDVDFRAELQRAQSGVETPPPQVRTVDGLMERPDGNNVSVDRESLAMAETNLQFRAGVQLLRTEFRRVLTAINEGK
jgi:flagellar basal-body rod protein FlgB